MSTAEKIFRKAQALPEQAQDTLLHIAEEMERKCGSTASNPLTLHEAAELRGKLAAWEDRPGRQGRRRVRIQRVQVLE